MPMTIIIAIVRHVVTPRVVRPDNIDEHAARHKVTGLHRIHHQSARIRRSPSPSRSQSPRRVTFSFSVRERHSPHRRRSSPYPQQNQALESEDEADSVQSLYTASSINSVNSQRKLASRSKMSPFFSTPERRKVS
ncbi:hypothetical protein V3C99_011447 [Haemonchus contortus]